MMRIGVFMAAAVILFMAACATVGVPPVLVHGNKVIDDDAVRPKLGKLDIRYGMMDAQSFQKAVTDQRKMITGDKGLSEQQKAQNLGKLNEQSFAAGQWWWAQYMYEKRPEKGAFNVSIFDAKGDNLVEWNFGSTTTLSRKMTMGAEVVDMLLITQMVFLKTKMPIAKKFITPDRSPVTFRVSALKDNRAVGFILPQ
jgi:hypothetical protein